MNLLFLGPPASGKDTQAEILSQKLGCTIVSTGQVMRDQAERGNVLAHDALKFAQRGEWVPDEMIYQLLREHLSEMQGRDIILTGAVRRASQIPMLDEALSSVGKQLDLVLYFDLPDEEVVNRTVNRWSCPNDGVLYNLHYASKTPKVVGICDKCGGNLVQRDDDKPDVLRKRLEEVRKYDAEILSVYEGKGILRHIDASPTIEQIAIEVEKTAGAGEST